MKTTIENIKTNQNICLAFFEIEKGWRINGKAKYYNSGKWLEFVKTSNARAHIRKQLKRSDEII